MPLRTASWDAEIHALQDLTVTAVRSHRIAAEALREAFIAASDQESGVVLQKILMAKIAAEFVQAIEDLGALAVAVARRDDGGVLHQYIAYSLKHVEVFYEQVHGSVPLHELLRLPAPD